MKIACISYFIPGKENNQGPNSLIYQLIANRTREISIDIYLPEKIFDTSRERIADIEHDLSISIYSLKAGRCGFLQQLYSFWWPSGAKIHSLIDDDSFRNYDLIWGYPYWTAPNLSRVTKKILISGMDSATLLYYRKVKSCIKDRSWKVFRYAPTLVRIFLFEVLFLKCKMVHVVGRADNKVMKKINVDSFYIPHPINPIAIRNVNFRQLRSQDSVRILVSNALDSFYGSKTVLKWLQVLLDTTHKLPNKTFEIVFHKGNQKQISSWLMRQKLPDQVKVSYIGWIDNYEEFLTCIDIQIFPLDVGAGTKTSVLTALYMNVICIGTTVACENIETRSLTDSLLVANSSGEFAHKFIMAVGSLDNFANRPIGDLIALEHSPAQSVANFWNTALQKND
jgi:hypothetical protein